MNGIIKIMALNLITLVLVLMNSSQSHAVTLHTTPDSLVYSLYFRQGGNLLMKDYRENPQAFLAMDMAFAAENTDRISKIIIIGSASPEGVTEFNNSLALKRAQSVRSYIIWRWGFKNQPTIEIDTDTDYLSAWIKAVESDPAVPRKDKVLEILNSKASIQTKWANIQLLKGEASSYIKRSIFPHLRNVVACVITSPTTQSSTTQDVVQQKVTPETGTVKGTTAIDTVNTKVPTTTQGTTATDTIKEILPTYTTTNKATIKAFKPESKVNSNNYRFAIKTNLLQGAVAFAPNLGLEYAINNKSTIELTGALNHWGLEGSSTSNKKLAHWVIQSEYRYWLKKSFNGHFFGVHALGGKYNIGGHNLRNLFLGGKLMESKYRYEGWTLGAGISYGYHLRLAKHWGIEFNLGIGVAHLRYDKYDCVQCGNKLGTETKTYFGPTKAGISLIYNLK